MKLLCPNCGTEVTHANQYDGRAVPWRVRVRFFGPNNPDELAADSDPDVVADAMGETLIRGLPSVADHVINLAAGWHQRPCKGLERDTLLHRIEGLRPTLSRRRGSAVWRIPYTTNEGEWLARVDLEKVGNNADVGTAAET